MIRREMSWFVAFPLGLSLGVVLTMWWFSSEFEPVIKRATYKMNMCDTGCRTDADITCEKFRQLLHQPVFNPRGTMGSGMEGNR